MIRWRFRQAWLHIQIDILRWKHAWNTVVQFRR